MFDMLPFVRVVLASVCCLVAIGKDVSVRAESLGGISVIAQSETTIVQATRPAVDDSHGITARFIPARANPGEIVELRVEMNRKQWGSFELQVPSQPTLHSIAVERVPLEYANGQYHQRESLFFQPVSSGTHTIGDARVMLSTADGPHEVELPELSLEVSPFDASEISDAPEPLPPEDTNRLESSPEAWGFALLAVLCLLVFIGGQLSRRRRPEPIAASATPKFQPTELIQELQSGSIPKDALERLLNDPDCPVSQETRVEVERAVYANDVQAAQLVARLQKELRT
ncbi:hypothetical protein [Aporhodopirellula aestuarii]|uniref:Protein BatD n=1 Tax=Aporhodopirellula aestuarii TaxID=2950107 RepID=A0ABT0U568_9BACT|nr:hypothetical protein [Aporhodopirellula aestuarii]MCM2372059.1 hypothetical protein [Aporhodopirellula aestuarii]